MLNLIGLSLHVKAIASIYHDHAHCPRHQIPTYIYLEYIVISLKMSWQHNQLWIQPLPYALNSVGIHIFQLKTYLT